MVKYIQDNLELVIGVITLVCLIAQIYILNKQLKLSFFSEYTKRYQEIILGLPTDINDAEFDYDNLSIEERNHVLKYMRVYFDLCSEEYYLHRYKSLDKSVWRNWEEGIIHSMSRRAYKDAWMIINESHFYNGAFASWMESMKESAESVY